MNSSIRLPNLFPWWIKPGNTPTVCADKRPHAAVTIFSYYAKPAAHQTYFAASASHKVRELSVLYPSQLASLRFTTYNVSRYLYRYLALGVTVLVNFGYTSVYVSLDKSQNSQIFLIKRQGYTTNSCSAHKVQ